MRFQSNETLARREKSELEKYQPPAPEIVSLAAYVMTAFHEAVDHRDTSGITEELLKDRRQRDGEYDPDKKAAIEASGGACKTFFNETDTKCTAACSQLTDLEAMAKEKPWGMEPTPIPDLPEDVKAQVEEQVLAEIQMLGVDLSGAMITQLAMQAYDERKAALNDQAKQIAKRNETKIEDQFAEGGFSRAFSEFKDHLTTYKTAFLKGPVLRSEKTLKHGPNGVEVETRIIPTWSAPSPHDIYFGPRTVKKNCGGYICEKITLSRSALSKMRGVDGWSASEIEKVLDYGGAASELGLTLQGETERRQLEDQESPHTWNKSDPQAEGVEFWGPVEGKLLREWGMEGVEDDYEFYEVQCIVVRNCAVKAILNPDPLDRWPYYWTSWIKRPGTPWGQSIPGKMRDCQEAYNASMRNGIENMALASGPQVAIDVDALDSSTNPRTMYPWKPWMYRGSRGGAASNARKPVDFFQPNSNIKELMEFGEYWSQKADDRTGVPRYMQGNAEIQGAGATASGMSMLLNQANKNIKQVYANIDQDIMRPAVEAQFAWNMLHLDDPALKGDVRVVARGLASALIKEQQHMQLQEFADRTNNPTDLLILGLEGRRKLLEKILLGAGLDKDAVPTEEQLKAMLQAQAQAAAMSGGEDGEDGAGNADGAGGPPDQAASAPGGSNQGAGGSPA